MMPCVFSSRYKTCSQEVHFVQTPSGTFDLRGVETVLLLKIRSIQLIVNLYFQVAKSRLLHHKLQ